MIYEQLSSGWVEFLPLFKVFEASCSLEWLGSRSCSSSPKTSPNWFVTMLSSKLPSVFISFLKAAFSMSFDSRKECWPPASFRSARPICEQHLCVKRGKCGEGGCCRCCHLDIQIRCVNELCCCGRETFFFGMTFGSDFDFGHLWLAHTTT